MKNSKILIPIALLVGLIIGRIWQANQNETKDATQEVTPAAPSHVYTCSMHPQIQQTEPGDCPICGMDLIPLEASSGHDESTAALEMSEAALARAGVETRLIKRGFAHKTIRLSGKLEYDETRERSLTARFPARIERLHVNFTGIKVSAGDALAEVYSPELLAAQRELLIAHRIDPGSALTRAAREKLLLWDLEPAQIEALLRSGEATDRFTLKAPIGGVVVAKQVREGDYVKTGEALLGIMDLSRLWVLLDANESDLPWLRYGQTVRFNVEALPGEEFGGRIAFIEPEVNRSTRSITLRLSVDNEDGGLLPGMFVRGQVVSELAAGGTVYEPDFAGKWISPMHPEIVQDMAGTCDVCGMDLVSAESLGYASAERDAQAAPLLVPASAVLRTGKRAVVYVQAPNSPAPLFEGREITLGPRAQEEYVVLAGLEQGERVVTQGAFKIDSALQIQARPSMMSMPSESAEKPVQAVAVREYLSLVKPYLALQASLAADDFEAAKTSLKWMMGITGHSGAAAGQVHALLAAKTIGDLRRPHFENFSNALIEAVRADPKALGQRLYLNHCSMVYPDRGADWLQAEEELRNPHWGAAMLHCGNRKEVFE